MIPRLNNNSAIVNILQDDLNKLISWSKLWLLLFNIDNCKVITYIMDNKDFLAVDSIKGEHNF